MKLECGKYYRTRDGREVGPLNAFNKGCPSEWFFAPHAVFDFAPFWNPDGTANFFLDPSDPKNNPFDIVEEIAK